MNPVAAPPLDISIAEEDQEQVDLVAFQGDSAQEILTIDVPVGDYSEMHLFVKETEGVWVTTSTSFAFTDIKVPSDRLQLNVPFEVKTDEPVAFVYDITVVRKGNESNPQGYNLLPVIAESGPDQPFKLNKGLDVRLPDDPVPGATTTVFVLRPLDKGGGGGAFNADLTGTTDAEGKVIVHLGDAPIATSTVLVLDLSDNAVTSTPLVIHIEAVGTTTAAGLLLKPSPAATSTVMVLNVATSTAFTLNLNFATSTVMVLTAATSTAFTLNLNVAGTTDGEGKLAFQVGGDPAATSTVMVMDSNGDPVANAEVTLTLQGELTFTTGNDPPTEVMLNVAVIVPAEGATVKVDGVNIGTTDAEGKLVISVPSDATELEIEAKLSDLEGVLKVSLE